MPTSPVLIIKASILPGEPREYQDMAKMLSKHGRKTVHELGLRVQGFGFRGLGFRGLAV